MRYNISASVVYNRSLQNILTYLADISLNVAQNFRTDLHQQIQTLAQLPYLYPEYEKSEEIGVALRKMVVTGYNYAIVANRTITYLVKNAAHPEGVSRVF